VPAASTRSVSKAARCRCIAAFRSAASRPSPASVDEIDLLVLKEAGVVSTLAKDARVILSGAITRKVTVRGLGVTKGARAAIEAAGGSVAE